MSKKLLMNTNIDTQDNYRRYYQEYEGTFITATDKSEDDTIDTSRFIEVTEIWGNTIQDEENLEDIQSVGELYVDEQGEPILDELGREQYKIEIESCNKNLFSNNIEDWEIGSINGTTGENADANNRIRTKHFIKIPKGSTIFWEKSNLSDKFGVRIYDKSKKCLFGGGFLGGNNTKLPHYDEAYYLKFIVAFSDGSKIIPQDVKNFIIQVEINSTRTEYVPHQSHKTTILLPCQLQKVDGVCDRLYWDSEKCKYVVEKNIFEYNFTGLDIIEMSQNDSATFHFGIDGVNVEEIYDDGSIGYQPKGICNKGLCQSPYNIHWGNGTPSSYGNNVFGCNTNRSSKLTTFAGRLRRDEGVDSIDAVKEWISRNNVYCLYRLQTPQLIETNITEKILLPCYEEKTHIFANSTVDATMKVLVPYKEII